MKDIYQQLKDLNMTYATYSHPPVFTVEDARKYDQKIKGGKNKNLFLRNKKGDQHYLVTVSSSKRVDLKQLAKTLGESKLSFASPDRLLHHLRLTPGSVSPFGLIYDIEKSVIYVLDTALMQEEKLAFHPNINTATIVISTEDFKKFLTVMGNKVVYF